MLYVVDGRVVRGVFISFPSPVKCPVDDITFRKLFDDLSFELTHTLPAFRRTQEVDWSESSCVG